MRGIRRPAVCFRAPPDPSCALRAVPRGSLQKSKKAEERARVLDSGGETERTPLRSRGGGRSDLDLTAVPFLRTLSDIAESSWDYAVADASSTKHRNTWDLLYLLQV